ncbi:aminotransferase class I/II-fold pyridoxal phosphate-dependent enzyme [Empedobacter brevis]|uniref:Aminotransferase class I/II-fold pyridoxal phosphate-dependent enzyme n=1 Tax=Empedobacter brevis TaxID=247 RepID=A0AAJ1QDY0_9FLAO|nr:methionine aminotransferase [Empedobacter brevis]MDM1072265.1 aminotransferase class I/II-fold pyridoxal phosphate-dependent enzyme [Empedobacter brevis]
MIKSKLPHVSTTIFSVMSQLATEHQAINLAQGFPDFNADPELINRLNFYSSQNYNQYAPMSGVEKLRILLSEKYSHLYQSDYDFQHEINITSGASQAIFNVISTLIHPNDEVIIFEPAYDLYQPTVELFGGKIVPIQLTYPDYSFDFTALKQRITNKTKLIIVNNPNNPTGRILAEDDLKQFEQILKDTNCYLLADEVYEHITFDGKPHYSFAQLNAVKDKIFIIGSFGKLFHITGWKIGYILAEKELMKEFRKCHQFNTFSTHTPSQYAIADYLEHPEHYLQLNDFFQQKRDFFIHGLKSTSFDVLPCEGTYFISANYAKISDLPDTEFAKQLTEQHKVATIPISAFYHNKKDDHVIRFCFAKKDETLLNALDNLNKV